MTESMFYSDRTTGPAGRVHEEVTAEVWQGLLTLISRRIDDGSLAREFPQRRCDDFADAITGTDRERFGIALDALIPRLRLESPPVPGTRSRFNMYQAPSTPVALDVVEVVAQYIADPGERLHHRERQHEHLAFDKLSRHRGRVQFRRDVELIFARNGLAFTIDNDIGRDIVKRLGPPEVRPLLSDFAPNTGDPDLDAMLRDAVTRYSSRNPQNRVVALEKLWDAFERLKTRPWS